MKSLYILMAVLASFMSLMLKLAHATDSDTSLFSSVVDASGNIALDKDFRLKLQHLGSWYVAEGDASGFHDVYTEASSIEYYREHRAFPDGATIVKELRGANAGDYTTGKNITFSTSQLKQWFVMIKDTKNRFPDNPNWGEGWGWALIKTGGDLGNVSTDYKVDCLGCHIPAKNNDWIYTEAYPVLQ